MSDVRSILERGIGGAKPPPDGFERMLRRRARKARNERWTAVAVASVLMILSLVFLVRAFRSPDAPTNPPSPTPTPTGIFTGIHGWIAYAGEGGIWAVDPDPGDARAEIRLSAESGVPVGWSGDGSKLLIIRPEARRHQALFVLKADGTETRLTGGDAAISGASIAPDGSKVVFATLPSGEQPARIDVVDVSGGVPRVLLSASKDVPEPFRTELYAPTFSPDGSQIAYFEWPLNGRSEYGLRVMNADGTGSRLLTPHRFRDTGFVLRLAWSPDGTRLAIDYGGDISTIGADGADLALVIPNGRDPHWSPDGARIAYDGGRSHLEIADADGKHVTEVGAAKSGPWNPLPEDSP